MESFYVKRIKEKSFLVIIDPQNDFITGSLANKDAQKCVPLIVDKINNFKGDGIIITQDTHFDDYLTTDEGKKLPIEHCIYNTEGWEIEKTILDAANKSLENGNIRRLEILQKETFGAIRVMSRNGVKSDTLTGSLLMIEDGEYNTDEFHYNIEMCGFDTDICVVSNALYLKGNMFDFATITVDAACCAGSTPENHKSALNVLKSCQIDIINENENKTRIIPVKIGMDDMHMEIMEEDLEKVKNSYPVNIEHKNIR